MRSSVCLAAGPGFSLDAVTCLDDHRGWSSAELSPRHRVVLVRRGTFRRMADGRRAVADPTMAYLGVPGEEERFAHPAGGDVCTSLSLSPGLWRTLAGDGLRPSRSTLYVDARFDLAHRRVLRAARGGDPAFELTESLLPLLALTLAQTTSAPAPSQPSHPVRTARPPTITGVPASTAGAATSTPGATTAATRTVTKGNAAATASAVTDAAREAISADHPAATGLISLAALLRVSPYQLSRAFTRELGVSLTHYRNRVRVGRALDRLEQGEPSLATLAADLGFADQAHLTRTIRRHAGHTPSSLRRLLGPG
ncbi:AraC family transcriptional regulator [Nonomuraea sp. NPDC050643]|uniref:helix-turn-helix domain-containing protein n=1 Tax=Nonomuraea sp. NPDC050643 TaxID=3155660 RepID=UPI0033F423CD